MKCVNLIISTNVELRLDGLPYSSRRAPRDPGAAVWFVRNDVRMVLACDRWSTVEHNLRAIERHLEAIRGQERWGVGSLDQAFTGYRGLPAPKRDAYWVDLGLDCEAVDVGQINSAFRIAVRERGPDADVTDLIEARDEGLRQVAS